MDQGPNGRKPPGSDDPKGDLLRLATVAAHQLRSPLNSIQTLLHTVIGGFAGPIDPRQRKLLEQAIAACGDGVDLVGDLLRMRSLEELSADRLVPVNLEAAIESVLERAAETASQKEITLARVRVAGLTGAPAWGLGDPVVVEEILFVLVDNAVKYTPRRGNVRVGLVPTEEEDRVRIEIIDDGIGIPEQDRERVFDEFFRASNARETTREGTGLGLAFARRAATRIGAALSLRAGEEGGTHASFELQASDPAPGAEELADAAAELEPTRPVSRRVVVVGGVAAGSKFAAKLIRLDPLAHVSVVERGKALSYAGCGLPYYISGVVPRQRDLISTPLGEERDSSLFHDLRNVRTFDLTEAVAIDREQRVVTVRSLATGRASRLPYDQLVLATGASPVMPEIPGVDLDGVYTLHGAESAEAIKGELEVAEAKDVVIVGAGLLGTEVTESLALTGARVSLVEQQSTVLGIIDPELALHVERYLSNHGVRVYCGLPVTALEGEDRVRAVRLADGRSLPCDFVILACGVRPNVDLAQQAGLELGETGAIAVDPAFRSSDPAIFAIGDCAEKTHVVTGGPAWIPMGSTAVKEARAAAINVCGAQERIPGVAGSMVIKIFDLTVARTGFGERAARAAGFEPVTALVPSLDRAHYLPTARPILLKLICDGGSGRLLGAQGIGEGAVDKRIDVVATALTAGMNVDQLAGLDLCYAPPYALATDALLAAANVARNKRAGLYRSISAADLAARRQGEKGPWLLDVRPASSFESLRLAGSVNIPLGSLRGRLHELPREEPIVIVSRTGLKSYEAALLLADRGLNRLQVLEGGLESWPYDLERL